MNDGFSAIRNELTEHAHETAGHFLEVQGEIAESQRQIGDTQRQMRVLHEDVVERISCLGEGR